MLYCLYWYNIITLHLKLSVKGNDIFFKFCKSLCMLSLVQFHLIILHIRCTDNRPEIDCTYTCPNVFNVKMPYFCINIGGRVGVSIFTGLDWHIFTHVVIESHWLMAFKKFKIYIFVRNWIPMLQHLDNEISTSPSWFQVCHLARISVACRLQINSWWVGI